MRHLERAEFLAGAASGREQDGPLLRTNITTQGAQQSKQVLP